MRRACRRRALWERVCLHAHRSLHSPELMASADGIHVDMNHLKQGEVKLVLRTRCMLGNG